MNRRSAADLSHRAIEAALLFKAKLMAILKKERGRYESSWEANLPSRLSQCVLPVRNGEIDIRPACDLIEQFVQIWADGKLIAFSVLSVAGAIRHFYPYLIWNPVLLTIATVADVGVQRHPLIDKI
ncbi:hypothetical protein [Afipia sp. 1NLS2]|uniref:hypothetical protein n=1 Tax=Afipia sp. 1NLS2 TaxID=666684 RepID=UPI00058E2F2F|nr:hypothetical protein [Afipia sp. 1NLS2]